MQVLGLDMLEGNNGEGGGWVYTTPVADPNI